MQGESIQMSNIFPCGQVSQSSLIILLRKVLSSVQFKENLDSCYPNRQNRRAETIKEESEGEGKMKVRKEREGGSTLPSTHTHALGVRKEREKSVIAMSCRAYQASAHTHTH